MVVVMHKPVAIVVLPVATGGGGTWACWMLCRCKFHHDGRSYVRQVKGYLVGAIAHLSRCYSLELRVVPFLAKRPGQRANKRHQTATLPGPFGQTPPNWRAFSSQPRFSSPERLVDF